MKSQAFSIYDTKAKHFDKIQLLFTKGEAIRSFTMISNNKETMISKTPEDYSLFHLGEFNHDNGIFTPIDAPEQIVTGLDVIKKEQK